MQCDRWDLGCALAMELSLYGVDAFDRADPNGRMLVFLSRTRENDARGKCWRACSWKQKTAICKMLRRIVGLCDKKAVSRWDCRGISTRLLVGAGNGVC